MSSSISYPSPNSLSKLADVIEQVLPQSDSPLSVFRRALKEGNQLLRQFFQETRNAEQAIHQRAWLVDHILLKAWHLAGLKTDQHLSLVAVGGYGRQELHPSSDIDLLILYDAELTAPLKENIENFLRFLWDIGLDVGSSVRTLAECRQQAAQDITVMTNLIESRLLLGSRELFQALQNEFLWSDKDFFAAKLQEQERRYHKYHDTAYNLEPNIKEGPGGLRDIQMIIWVTKRHFHVNKLQSLVYHGFLTPEEYDALVNEQEFLWQIRWLLHTIANRKEDRLAFDYQRQIAVALGYQDDEHRLAVEKFMKRYYRTAQEISRLNEMLLHAFQQAVNPLAVHTVHALNRRFQIRNHYIEATYDKVFIDYPFALLEIFLLIQQHPTIQGIFANTGRLLRYYRYLIDKSFHEDLRARSLFFEIIRQPQGQTRAFRYMNRYGILGAYIPAFGRIVGQMQYDLFHAYTVDQHTLFVLRNLRRLMIKKHNAELPLCSQLMQNIEKPEILYLAALFHDIAKGRGGDHSKLGEIDAVEFCQAHGLSEKDSRFAGWLVRHHLVMSMTAQRQDISDPAVINNFAQQVGSIDRLVYLYLLTVADIRATNPNLWTSWKAALLEELYKKTRLTLQIGAPPLDKETQIKAIQQQSLHLLINPPIAEIQSFWQEIGEDYFLRSAPADIARETQAVLENKDQPALALVRQVTTGGTSFSIYSRSQEFLFADTTLCLERENITIVDAVLAATTQGMLLIYTVLEENGQPIVSAQRIEHIRRQLVNSAAHPSRYFCPVNRHPPRRLKYFRVPTRVTFSQKAADNYTTMEVVTTDRPGVLSRVAQAFLACGISVKSAKIATLGERVEDIFFIMTKDNLPLPQPDQLDCLQEQLSLLLDKDVEIKTPEVES